MGKKIIIGIDIRDIKVAATGQKTFLQELYFQFKKINNPEFEFVYFTTKIPVYKGRNKLFLIVEHLRYQGWKQAILPVLALFRKCDVLFCTDYFVPFFHLGFKSVQVFHDAFFYEYPEHYNKYWMPLFTYLAIPAANKSAFIITPTNYTRNTILHYTKIPLDKLITVYEAPKSFHLLPTTISETPNITLFNTVRYIFHVGVIEKRKNLPALIKAYHLLINSMETDLKLILAGKGTNRKDSDDTLQIRNLISALHLEDKVILTGYLSDQELSIAYKNAFMYVFPSINEGFGLPLLEAFQAKLPVLVADNSCLPEVGQTGVLTFNPFNIQDIFEKMKLVIENKVLRQELINKGQERLQHFSWEKSVLQLLDIFKKAVNKP